MRKRKFNCVKQLDATDCGAACLATVAAYHGLKMSVTQMREISGTDTEGTNAYGIIEAAKKLGFDAKAVTTDDPTAIFSKFPMPCIAHVSADGEGFHYVVLHKITKEKITIADPARGIVRLSVDDFFKIWGGVLIFLKPTKEFKTGNKTKSIFKRFFGLLAPHKKVIAIIFLMSLIYSAIGVATSFFFMFIMDTVLPSGLTGIMATVSLAVIAMYIFQSAWSFFRQYLILGFTRKLESDLQLGYCKHVMKLPLNFFGTRKIGEIISRLQDASNIQGLLSTAALSVVLDALMAIGGAVVLFIISPLLFGITAGVALVYGIIVFCFNKPLRNINRKQMHDSEVFSSYIIESLTGIETVKSFRAEESVLDRAESKFKKMMTSIFKGGILGTLSGTLSGTVGAVGGIALLWAGIALVINGNLTLGQLFTFNALSAFFLGPIQSLINLQSQMQSAIVASDRLGEVLDLNAEKSDEERYKDRPSLYGDIAISRLNFRYGMRNLILKDVDMYIGKGERIALVGESGSGKTTLAKLLINFYKPESGSVTINGFDLQEIHVDHLREKTAYIAQDIFLFSGSIIDNLRFGNGASQEEIVEVCKRTKAHDFIEAYPLGYNTKLEENGNNLSVGQRQRLVIARALLKKPEILIMDEATSNLDTITEKAISSQINKSVGEVTTIIIAHRLSTIMQCDRIFVMNDGTICEVGTHFELMKKKGVYHALWKGQIPKAQKKGANK
jgi:ATP-binding cassette subfamily B protein